ncbi:hypothetical protein [Pseudoxanthomonas putridarboris]|uniref:Polysaccharide lyase n=1 Tax=Pseudoxanthomonas putridarboris TaxID=752605 RepID=A0ABU9J0R9_9GAMM
MPYLTLQAPGLPSRFDYEGTVLRRSQIKAGRGEVATPVAWPQFVCIDDPDAVDDHAWRTPPAKDRAYRFDGLRVKSPRSKLLTQAADGARLICRNVSLRKGDVLRFHWHFFSWGDDARWNDFAGFEMVPDDPDDYGQPLEVLCDLAELNNKGRKSSGWNEHGWEMLYPFKGSLIWIAANGQAVTNPNRFRLSSAAYTNPPALLLDDIRITAQ